MFRARVVFLFFPFLFLLNISSCVLSTEMYDIHCIACSLISKNLMQPGFYIFFRDKNKHGRHQ